MITQYKYAGNLNSLIYMARIAGINIPQNKVVSIALNLYSWNWTIHQKKYVKN